MAITVRNVAESLAAKLQEALFPGGEEVDIRSTEFVNDILMNPTGDLATVLSRYGSVAVSYSDNIDELIAAVARDVIEVNLFPSTRTLVKYRGVMDQADYLLAVRMVFEAWLTVGIKAVRARSTLAKLQIA